MDPSEEAKSIASKVRHGIKGKVTLFDSFRKVVLDNLASERNPNGISYPLAFDVARYCNPIAPGIYFGVFLLFTTLGLNQENAVQELRPFLAEVCWADRLNAASLELAEDYCGLERDSLYKPITGRND